MSGQNRNSDRNNNNISNLISKFYQQTDKHENNAQLLEKVMKVLEALHNVNILMDYALIGVSQKKWQERAQIYMKQRDHEVEFQMNETKYFRLYQYQYSGIINMVHAFRWLLVDFPNLTTQEALDIQAYWILRHEGMQEIWKGEALAKIEAKTCTEIKDYIQELAS